MQSNLQTTITDTLSLISATRQAEIASIKLFGRLNKDTLDTLILLLSLAGLVYYAMQHVGSRR